MHCSRLRSGPATFRRFLTVYFRGERGHKSKNSKHESESEHSPQMYRVRLLQCFRLKDNDRKKPVINDA